MSFLQLMQNYKSFFVKTLLLSFLIPTLFFSQTQKAEAFWPTFDVGGVVQQTITAVATPPTAVATGISAGANVTTTILTGADHLKKFVLDPIAYGIAKMIIKQLTAQTVNWINSGFKGNPAFVTDPNSFFLDVGDKMAAQVLSNTSLSRLCTPFRAQVRLSIAKNYLTESNRMGSCTLGQIENNFDNFTNNFSSGGWDAFFSVTQNSQNNPYGSYMNTKNQLNVDVAAVGQKYQKQLEQGNGFLSFEKCKPGSTRAGRTTAASGEGTLVGTITTECVRRSPLDSANPSAGGQCLEERTYQMDSNGNKIDITGKGSLDDGSSGVAEGDCSQADKEVVTPGSVINNQLQKVVGSGVTQLELANSINQVVSALMTQMFQQVVGGLGNGLRGLTQKNSTNSTSGRSLIEQMAKGSPEEGVETKTNASNIDKTASQSLADSKAAAGPIAGGGSNPAPNTGTLIDLPSITLIGEATISIPVGSIFNDPGVAAADNTDGDITSKVQTSGVVDTNTTGQYSITYIVFNSKGNSTSATRTVNVTP